MLSGDGEMSLESLGKVLKTDILIVGGSVAGLSAALRAKEVAPELDVVVVDRGYASFGFVGKSCRGGGNLFYLSPEDDPEEFVRYHVYNIGYFLNDQVLLRKFAYMNRAVIRHVESWGVKFVKRPDGKYFYTKVGPFPWSLIHHDLDHTRQMALLAQRLGVRFVDKVMVSSLLKDANKVAGAVGFGVEDNSFYIFKAKAVVLATGSQNYGGLCRMWNSTGTGIKMAYDAGAEMRNPEFGNYAGGFIYAGEPAAAMWFPTGHDALYNAKGENLTEKYIPIPRPDSTPEAHMAWYKEVMAGNGPIYVNLLALLPVLNCYVIPPELRLKPTFADRFWIRTHMLERAVIKDPPTKIRVQHAFQCEMSCVKVDHLMKTTVPGLFAVGDVSYNGSAWTGAAPSPPGWIKGTGTLNAWFTGMIGGESVASYVRALKEVGYEPPEVDYAQAKEIKEKLYEPLQRSNGVSPYDVIPKIWEAVYPIDYIVIKSKERLEEALNRVLAFYDVIERLKARDHHELVKCIDAQSMALTAEIFYRASLMRTESRGGHFREDHPYMDNKNWLKWIIVKKNGDKMRLYTEDIPIQEYPYKPPQEKIP